MIHWNLSIIAVEETVLFFGGGVDGWGFKYGFSYWCRDTRQLLNL